MSPEIQEWSHKSRSRINNLYLLRGPITKEDSLTSDCLIQMTMAMGFTMRTDQLPNLCRASSGTPTELDILCYVEY